VADHGYGSVYGQAPALTLIQNLRDYGKKAVGINIKALLQSSDILRQERKIYEPFENPYRGHDPTVAHYKLTGGAVGAAYEQAERVGLLDRMAEIFREMGIVQEELGNWWSVTPGSQILLTPAVNNVLYGRYERPSLDLQNLLLGRYGPLPFYYPAEMICEKVLEYQRPDGKSWRRILSEERGLAKPQDVDLEAERLRLAARLGRAASDADLALYLQFPFDTLSYFEFEARYGKTWLLPPEIWFRREPFQAGERINFADEQGVPHSIEIISTRREGDTVFTSLVVDHHYQTLSGQVEGGRVAPIK
jgi:pyruvate carboxylase